MIYLVVNLSRNNAHSANFAFLTAHFSSKLLIALGPYFAQNIASKFGQGLLIALVLYIHTTTRINDENPVRE